MFHMVHRAMGYLLLMDAYCPMAMHASDLTSRSTTHKTRNFLRTPFLKFQSITKK